MKTFTISHHKVVLFLILAAASVLYLASFDPNKCGFFHDDGIYVVTGKSIAQGEGYKIASLPNKPAQTKYPPFYPFILSIVWLLFPSFPSNLSALLLPSVIATISYLFLSKHYLVAQLSATHRTALWAIMLVAFNPRTIVLANSALSDSFYTFLSIAGIWTSESYLKKPAIRSVLFAMITLSLAILTRTAGISLLISILLFALLRRKLVKSLPILVVCASVFLAWTYWARIHAVESVNPAMMYYTSYLGDWREIIESVSYVHILLSNAFMLIPMSIPVVSLGFGYKSIFELHPQLFVLFFIFVTFVFILMGFLRNIRLGLSLAHLYILCYLLIHILWPYSSYDRFLMPLFPFFSYFLVSEFTNLIATLKSTPRRPRYLAFTSGILAVIAGAGVVLLIYGHLISISREVFQSRSLFASRALLDQKLAFWIRNNTQHSDILLCYPDPRYYLYTGRKTISAALSMKGARDTPQWLFRQILKTGSSYIIHNHDYRLEAFRPNSMNKDIESVLNAHPDVFVPVFSIETATIYRIAKPLYSAKN